MALFRYLTKEKNLIPPGPDFDKTRELLDKGNSPSPSKRGSYKQYSPKLRCEIGKYVTENGNARAVAKYSPLFEKKLSESTDRGFKSHYIKETKSLKRKLVDTDSTDSDDLGVSELVPSKRGRKFLLGEELDGKVRALIKNIREAGGVINTAIVCTAGKGIVLSHDRSLLLENGGGIELSKYWAKSILKRMNMVKRKGTTSKKTFVVENFEQDKQKFLNAIEKKVELKNIPPELIINWDQTGIPCCHTTDIYMYTRNSSHTILIIMYLIFTVIDIKYGMCASVFPYLRNEMIITENTHQYIQSSVQNNMK